MKIIDFRVRPPVRGILKTAMYANAPRRDRFIHQLGMQPAPSASKKSMPMLLKEMNKAGVVRGVVMARISDMLGSISNEDVHAICKAYPKQFVPLIGNVRISIAIFSYDGDLYFGVTGDYDSSSDIDILTAGVERSMDELLALVPARVPSEAP